MKQLKFNHSFAELIRQGKKTTTFRMYDDKALSVNDEVELLDKVDPSQPVSWKIIAIARIDSIVEKRLSAITEQDLLECEQYDSPDELLTAYRQYYGERVVADMPIKVVRFKLSGERPQMAEIDAKRATIHRDLSLYANGGSRGNPGPSACGYVVMDNDKILVKRGIYLGVTTNNQAEYIALKLGLEELQKIGTERVHVYMDSLLVINQMLGVYKVKNRDLWPINDVTQVLAKSFKRINFTHVPRSMNKIAGSAVDEVLDQAGSTG
jgi:ribonuclease HI